MTAIDATNKLDKIQSLINCNGTFGDISELIKTLEIKLKESNELIKKISDIQEINQFDQGVLIEKCKQYCKENNL